MNYKKLLFTEGLLTRFFAFLLTFWVLFVTTIVISHLSLPEGLLLGKTTGGNLELSSNFFVSTLQILTYNLISIICIVIGSLFARRKNEKDVYHSYGANVLIVLAVLFGLVLGTNSFGIQVENVSLLYKILGLFDVTQRSAIWEITSIIMMTSVFSNKSLVFTTGKKTTTIKWKQLFFSKLEIGFIIVSLLFLVVGAIVESTAIYSVLSK